MILFRDPRVISEQDAIVIERRQLSRQSGSITSKRLHRFPDQEIDCVQDRYHY